MGASPARRPGPGTVSVLSRRPARRRAPHPRRRCIVQQTDELILGVDTHDGAHVGVLIDALGRRRGAVEIPTDAAGHDRLLAWSRAQGRLRVAGVEGTGSYAASLVRFLAAHGVRVVEVNGPNRQRRRRRGTSDPADAEAAARVVLAGEAT